MKKLSTFIIVLVTLTALVSCRSTSAIDLGGITVSDTRASNETKLLYRRIQEIAKKGVAFGHQDATAYGVGWKHQDDPAILDSDIKRVTGKLPAVHGYDIGHIELDSPINLDTVSFELMRNHIKQVHERGGIITMSWHLDNPVSGGSSWDTTPAVSAVLKGGSEREKYELWMGRLASFLNSLKDGRGKAIPVVFRPYHEMNGGWFWWGRGNTTPAEYKQLWRETQELLYRNNVHNLLYAYSPNTLSNEQDFDLYYPGDGYVDILGVDIYNHSGNEAFTRDVKNNLAILRQKAAPGNKPYALTESGNNNFGEDQNWWTETLYPGIKDSGIAWMLFWRNARPDHYFGTYPGEISEEDFKEFAELEEVLFLDEVGKILN